MKKNILFLLPIFLFLTVIGTVNAATTIRVLAIGNSFSMDAVENYLYELGEADDVNFIIGNVYYGGCSLQQHYEFANTNANSYSYRKIVNGVRTATAEQNLETCITDEPWDYISFQQASPNSGQYNTYFPYLNDLMTYVKARVTNPEVVYFLHQTWAYEQTSTHAGFANYGKNQMTMYNAIINATNQVKAAVPDLAFIIPAGTAIQNGRTSGVGDNFCRDGYHLDLTIGRFTAACTWFEKLTGKNVLENSYTPNMGDFQIEVAKNAAHYAVQTPFEVTSMEDFVIGDSDGDLTYPINICFGNATTSPLWNSITSAKKGTFLGLKDSEGRTTHINLEIDDAFGGINQQGPTSTNTSLNMPSDVSSASFYGCGIIFGSTLEPTGGFRLYPLSKDYTYSFRMFTSRNATDNRETYFRVTGDTEVEKTINASNNKVLLELLDMVPNANDEIRIDLGYGKNNNNANLFYYINALQIEATPVNTSVPVVNQSMLKLFPNPVRDFATINTESTISTAVVYDILGQRLLSFSNVKDQDSLDFSQLKKGLYILRTPAQSVSFVKE